MRREPPVFSIFDTDSLAIRLERACALPTTQARDAARWLMAPQGDWPEALAPYQGLCPDPELLRRLICCFEPDPENPNATLLRHLTTGWQQGEAPAPWFDPMGYEVLSAARRTPEEASILHYVREGGQAGLDPDPGTICNLSELTGCSLVVTAQTPEDCAPLLAFLDTHLASPQASPLAAGDGPEWILFDTSAGHATARAAAGTYDKTQVRILAADPALAPEDRAALIRREAAHPHILYLPTPLPTDAPPVAPPLALPAAPDVQRANRRDRLRRGELAPRILIRCPAPDLARAHRWGDFHFAESLAAALRRAGCDTKVALAEDWQTETDPPPDATLLLRGVRRCRPRPGPVNLMWMLSHPDRIALDELARYDHVFVASLSHARALSRTLGNRVSALLQCSDPDRFLPDTASAETDAATPAHPLLFVGNSRKAERWVVSAAIAAGHDLALYGAEWEGTPAARYLRAENLPNTQLGSYYRRAGIVLNDHWPDMAARGFVSNRLFDVAMARGFPISDSFDGAGMFFGLLPQVRDAAELDHAIRYFTANPSERTRRADALHRLVRQRHDFGNRAALLLARLRKLF